jgi:phosphohistidine phosphatase
VDTARRLVLVRHAKAADAPTDLVRPLSARGRRDAAAIGQLLAGRELAVDLVVVSPALRARQTWEAAETALSSKARVRVDDRVYENVPDRLLEIIHDTPTEVRVLAVVGHNPSMAGLAALLDDGTGDRPAARELTSGFATAAVAVYDVPAEWAGLQPHAATLQAFVVARADG